MIGQQAAVLEAPEQSAYVETFRGATTRDFERLENSIAARVLPVSADVTAAAVRLQYRGRTIVALPMDTRRFVRAMARHISLN